MLICSAEQTRQRHTVKYDVSGFYLPCVLTVPISTRYAFEMPCVQILRIDLGYNCILML